MMATLKKVNVTTEMIEMFTPGDITNNPVTIALKEQLFPDANEIIVTGEGIWVDGAMIAPQLETTRFINDWNKGKKVQPMILGFYV